MKELTIEQKAKAYDEAIERYKAKQEYESQKVREFIEYLFPKLKESEEEKIRKELIDFVKSRLAGFPQCEKFIAWIEKQGEQKTINKIQLGKKYKCIASPRYSVFMTGEIYKPEDEFLCSLMNLCYDCFEPIEDGELKPADKVEPKFKVGDWVVFNEHHNGVYQVEKVQGLRYYLRHYLGGTLSVHFDNELIRLWTIRDAKSGDVLVSESACGLNTWYCIFKSLDDDENMTVYCYLARDGRFQTKEELCSNKDPRNVKPATKEQRDTLMKAMADAGYTFDFKKKELKKIEQKSATMSLDEAIEHCKEKSCGNNACALEHKQLEKWLNELKELKEQKLAWWSEEDEVSLVRALAFIKNTSLEDVDDIKESVLTWIISLKDRIQPQQQEQWKPSEEQMHDLKMVIDSFSFEPEDHLQELYEQLKQL